MFQHIIHKLRSLRVLRVIRSVIVVLVDMLMCFVRCDVNVYKYGISVGRFDQNAREEHRGKKKGVLKTFSISPKIRENKLKC